MVDIRVCVDCTNTLGESPVWDVAEQRLYWVDSDNKQLWRCAPDGSEVRTWSLPSIIGSFALRKNGGAVLALADGFHLFDFNSGALQRIAHPEEAQPDVRLNDGKVDSRGRFIVGSLDTVKLHHPDSPAAPRGSLYRLDADHSVHRLDTGFAVSNGPCWSADKSTFYFTDSMVDTIYAYGWDEQRGELGQRRTFIKMGPREVPDGATVDADGGYWTVSNGAFTGIGEVRRYTPDGRLDRTIVLPAPKPTSLMFGGPNLDILFVTTMKIPVAPTVPDTPLDGKLFAIRGLGVRGLPELRFGG